MLAKHAQVIVRKQQTTAVIPLTKNAIDIAGRDANCRPSLDPRTNPTGSTHKTTFETDGVSGRFPQTQEIWARGADFPVVSSQGVEVHLGKQNYGSEWAGDGGEC
jgi:hypothetical protein